LGASAKSTLGGMNDQGKYPKSAVKTLSENC
jgi:hypothetical protein